MTRRATLVLGALAGAATTALVGGFAWAAIPGPGGVIQGCYGKGGTLIVVDALPCPKGSTSLPWNQQGPKGDPGEKGLKGDQGLPGTPGTVACPETTVNGGTNAVELTTNDRVDLRVVGQFAPDLVFRPTTFVCAGNISNFQVTISGNVGGTVLDFNAYIVSLRAANPGAESVRVVGECRFTIASDLSCAAGEGVFGIDPGAEVYVNINPENNPTPRSFDWSADVDSPGAVWP